MQQTQRQPRGGLSENAISILIRRLLAVSAFCASRADRLGGKIQRSSTQAISIAFAACCRFEDAFGQRGLLHRGLQFRRKAGPSVVIIERNAFIFVIGGIEIEILPYFANKICA